MPFLSVRLVITLVTVAAIAVVGFGTVVIVVLISRGAVDRVGRLVTDKLAITAADRVFSIVREPADTTTVVAQQLETLASTDASGYQWPSSSNQSFERHMNVLNRAFMRTRNLSATSVLFTDNTVATATVGLNCHNVTASPHQVASPSAVDSTIECVTFRGLWMSRSIASTREPAHVPVNVSLVRQQPRWRESRMYSSSQEPLHARGIPWVEEVRASHDDEPATDVHEPGGAFGLLNLAYRLYPQGSSGAIALQAANIRFMSLTSLKAIYARPPLAPGQPASASSPGTHIGFAFSIIPLLSVSEELVDARATPNTKVVATDFDGYLLGVSDAATDDFVSVHQVTSGQATGPGCQTIVSGITLSTGTEEMCRTHSREVHPSLARVDTRWRRRARPGVPSAQKLTDIDGESFFVSVAQVPLLQPGYVLFVTLSVPERELLGDIDTGTVVAFVLVGLTILVAGVCMVIVASAFIRRPVRRIAKDMRRTARLDWDDEAAEMRLRRESSDAAAERESAVPLHVPKSVRHPSRLTEVHELQLAFVQLSRELRTIRSYLPEGSRLTSQRGAASLGGAPHSEREAGLAADDDVDDLADLPGDNGTSSVYSTTSKAYTTGSNEYSDDDTVELGEWQQGAAGDDGVYAERGNDAMQPPSRRSQSVTSASRSAAGRQGSMDEQRRGAPTRLPLAAACEVQRARRAARWTARKLRRRNVTVGVFEACFTVPPVAGDSSLYLRAIETWVDAVHEAVSRRFGIIVGFDADRVLVAFNAALPCANHAERACQAAIAVEALATDGLHGVGCYRVSVTAGIASGPCLVGNSGSASVKTFTAVGPAASHALVLQKLAAGPYGSGTRVLASASTVSAAPSISSIVVAAVPLPGSMKHERRTGRMQLTTVKRTAVAAVLSSSAWATLQASAAASRLAATRGGPSSGNGASSGRSGAHGDGSTHSSPPPTTRHIMPSGADPNEWMYTAPPQTPGSRDGDDPIAACLCPLRSWNHSMFTAFGEPGRGANDPNALVEPPTADTTARPPDPAGVRRFIEMIREALLVLDIRPGDELAHSLVPASAGTTADALPLPTATMPHSSSLSQLGWFYDDAYLRHS